LFRFFECFKFRTGGVKGTLPGLLSFLKSIFCENHPDSVAVIG
jgi:hypothetical protein